MGKALGGFGGLALIGITVLAEFYWSSNSDGGEPRVGQPFGPGPSHGPPEVTTKYGRLAGTWLSSRDGRAVAAFEGVPYAAAPVGELRFQRPQPVDSWHGVRSASQRGPPCLQHRRGAEVQDLGVEGSEDCLHLNVYAPEKVSGALPVLFWIHGGGWQSGTGSAYGPEFLLDKDVVFVSFNYRLGPLGFLSTGDHVVAGNNGLKDTVFALQWVNDNIAAFGGDPGMVTVLGHGTGAASVHLLTLSTLAKGLFQRAVAMSGSALAPWSFQPPRGPARLRRSLATHTSCPETPSEALVECLRTKDAADIVGVDHGWAQFGPALERGDPVPFLDVHPRDAYSAGYLADGVPFLTGFTEDAGIRQARDVFLDENLVQKISEDFDSFMKLVLCLHDYPEPLVSETLKQIRHFYFGDGPISKMMVNNVSDVLTDGLFSYAATETAKLHKTHSKAPVFLYEFARRGSREALDAGSGPLAGDELQYLFPSKEPAAAERLAQDDELVSRQLIDHLVHFAQTGSSTADDSWQEVVHPNEAEFMYLSTPGKSKMSANFAPQRMRLWDQLPIRIGSVPVMHDEL